MTKDEKKAYDKAYYLKNKAKKKAQMEAWRLANPERNAQLKQDWAEKNRDKCRASKTRYKKANPALYNSMDAKRRAKIKEVYVELSDWEKKCITHIYWVSNFLTEFTGIKHHVDHIKPIAKGGLHHPNNLQVLTATENLRKGCKYDVE